jgi:hypothetical protein
MQLIVTDDNGQDQTVTFSKDAQVVGPHLHTPSGKRIQPTSKWACNGHFSGEGHPYLGRTREPFQVGREYCGLIVHD